MDLHPRFPQKSWKQETAARSLDVPSDINMHLSVAPPDGVLNHPGLLPLGSPPSSRHSAAFFYGFPLYPGINWRLLQQGGRLGPGSLGTTVQDRLILMSPTGSLRTPEENRSSALLPGAERRACAASFPSWNAARWDETVQSGVSSEHAVPSLRAAFPRQQMDGVPF